jgi:hypothetical protein
MRVGPPRATRHGGIGTPGGRWGKSALLTYPLIAATRRSAPCGRVGILKAVAVVSPAASVKLNCRREIAGGITHLLFVPDVEGK